MAIAKKYQCGRLYLKKYITRMALERLVWFMRGHADVTQDLLQGALIKTLGKTVERLKEAGLEDGSSK